MIFDINACCRVEDTVEKHAESGEWVLPGGLWVVLLSSGSCIGMAEREQTIRPGSVLIGGSGMELHMLEPCHFLGLQLGGSTAEQVGAQLEELRVLDGGSCPGAAETIQSLCGGLPGWQQNAAAFRLLCQLSEADAAQSALPPLAAAAVIAIRENYSRLYGLEDLSEQLNVSREHLVRVFKKSMGVTPGHYLNSVRIAHAKEFLLQREYSLEVVATLCGYSGANYLCKVFRRETGLSPAEWRRRNLPKTAQNGTAEQAEELMLYL